jgi:Uma2 family endonuclease
MTATLSRQRDPNLWTADQFLAFLMTRPDEERWQLVDGLPMMMTPPSFNHQKIGKNLLRLLDAALESRGEFEAYYELGIRVPGREDFNPIPDVLIVRADAEFEYYADQFFLVGEVISPSNTAEMIERKLALYQTHPDNLYCLTVDQSARHVAVYARDLGWARADLRSLDDMIELPAFGLKAPLSAIYAGTPLGR